MHIYFDMDGTIADLYSVDGWLEDIIEENTRPYAQAQPMVNTDEFKTLALKLIDLGFTLGIISWGAKNGSNAYTKEVKRTKIEWLNTYFGKNIFSEIHVVKYGTPKYSVVKNKKSILFDDEKHNRDTWKGTAYDQKQLMEVLRQMCR